MARQGTLEILSDGNYKIGSLVFRDWLVEHKIAGAQGRDTKSAEAFAQWLHQKEFKLGGLITNEEINTLQKAWKAIPKSFFSLAKKLLTAE